MNGGTTVDPRTPQARAAPPPLAYDPEERHPLVTALLADQLGDPAAVDAAVHADDEMLRYLVEVRGGDRDQGLVAYLASGLTIFRGLSQLVAWHSGGWQESGRLLDFASGYGRVTRFLASAVPAERLWVSEIQPGAVEFQAARFGVQPLPSAPRADAFRCDERFDAVFATSLFTHLPEEAFHAWLRRLAVLLTPGGMLVFTTHDPTLLDGPDRPAGGFLFRPVSESRALDLADYGSTWAAEGYVREAVAAAGPDLSCHRIARGLHNIQDLYVVVRRPGADFSGLVFDGDPRGYVESCHLAGEGRLVLRGWAWDGGWGRPVEEVRLLVDGRPAGRAREFGRRPDVAALLGLPTEQALDWICTGEVPADASRSRVTILVKLVLAGGGEHLLHLSSLESALLWSAWRDLDRAKAKLEAAEAWAGHEITRLEAQVAAMEASRFWKLRNAWFRLKGWLGGGAD